MGKAEPIESTQQLQDTLDTRLENLKAQKSKLVDALAEAKSVKLSIQNESQSVTTWMADNLFRTDNPERKKEAINALSELADAIEDAINKSNELENLSIELKLVIGLISEWSDYVRDLIPVLQVQIAVPEMSSSSADTWDTIIGITGIVFGVALASALFLGPLGLSVAALALLLDILFVFIGGIIVGEERKKAFEKIKAEADKQKSDLQADVTRQLEDALEGIGQFFKESGKAFHAAGWPVDENSSAQQIRKALEKNVSDLRTWSMAFKMAKISHENNPAAGIDGPVQVAAQVVAGSDKTKQAEFELLFKAAILYPEKSVAELVDILGISPEAAKRIKAQEMLMNGNTPDQIAAALDMPVDNVKQIAERNKDQTQALEKLNQAA